MSAMKMAAMISLAGFALACGRSEQTRQDQALNPALRSDLERAAAPTSALASTQFTPTQVVSAIELGESPEVNARERTAVADRRTAPRVKPSASRTPSPRVAPVSAKAPDPAPEPVLVAVVPEPTASSTPETESVGASDTRPSAGPRPTPNPVDYPAPQPRTRNGDGMGPLIGVIIRGGGIGDDHCEIRPGRGSIPIMINQRAPIVIHTTFPRGGW
jgi:hypothetical protein